MSNLSCACGNLSISYTYECEVDKNSEEWFTKEEIESFRNSNTGIYSITVYAEKPITETKTCCGPDCCN